VRVAVDLRSVHTVTPLAGLRFQNRLVVLPRRGDLRRFVREKRVDYVVARAGSHYDVRARHDPSTFRPFGGLLVQTYRVK
jgi:hypothetical protein